MIRAPPIRGIATIPVDGADLIFWAMSGASDLVRTARDEAATIEAWTKSRCTRHVR